MNNPLSMNDQNLVELVTNTWNRSYQTVYIKEITPNIEIQFQI